LQLCAYGQEARQRHVQLIPLDGPWCGKEVDKEPNQPNKAVEHIHHTMDRRKPFVHKSDSSTSLRCLGKNTSRNRKWEQGSHSDACTFGGVFGSGAHALLWKEGYVREGSKTIPTPYIPAVYQEECDMEPANWPGLEPNLNLHGCRDKCGCHPDRVV